MVYSLKINTPEQIKEKISAAQRKYRATIHGRAKQLIDRANHASKRRKHPKPSITIADLIPILSNGVCQISGLKLDFKAPRKSPWSPSLDRIDSNLPYTKDNIRIVCWALNAGCGSWGLEIYKTVAKQVIENGF
jgi:hypothetical protein